MNLGSTLLKTKQRKDPSPQNSINSSLELLVDSYGSQFILLVSSELNGFVRYDQDDLKPVHYDMNISDYHFDAVLECFVKSAEELEDLDEDVRHSMIHFRTTHNRSDFYELVGSTHSC